MISALDLYRPEVSGPKPYPVYLDLAVSLEDSNHEEVEPWRENINYIFNLPPTPSHLDRFWRFLGYGALPEKFDSLDAISLAYHEAISTAFFEKASDYILSSTTVFDELKMANRPTLHTILSYQRDKLRKTPANYPVWKIDNVYLLGSIHAGQESTKEYVEKIALPLLLRCSTVWAESNVFSTLVQRRQAFWMQINPKKASRIKKTLNGIEKVFSASGVTSDHGLDCQILSLAMKKQKRLYSIEDPLSSFAQIPYYYDLCTAENATLLAIRFIHRIIKNYQNPYKSQCCSFSSRGDLVEDPINLKREVQQLEKIESLIRTGENHLCVIGLAHCREEGGIPSQLEAKGHYVKKIRVASKA